MAFLHGVEVVEVDDGPRAIRTLSSAIVGLVGTALRGPVNTPTVIATRSAGAEAFGADGGTIPDALAAIFDQSRTTVVVVNCLDPATRHRDVQRDLALVGGKVVVPADADAAPVRELAVKSRDGATTYAPSTAEQIGEYVWDPATRTISRARRGGTAIAPSYAEAAVAEAPYPVAEGVVTLPHLRIKAGSVTVKSADGGTTYQPAAYALDLPAGTITRAADGAIPSAANVLRVAYTYESNRIASAGAEVRVEYELADASAVIADDVVGGTTAAGAQTGSVALLGAESVTGLRPRILIAPGWSGQLAVATALLARADRLRAIVVVEGPDDDDAAATSYRENFGSRRAYLVDPAVRVSAGGETVTRPNSAYVAGVIARVDAERGFWWSPSNREIRGIVGTTRPVDLELGVESAAANRLNADEVATIVRLTGWRLWGNRTCSSDAKYAFLSVARTADLIMDSILRAHLWAVDRNITRTYIEDVAEGVNAYLRELRGLGAILGGACAPSDLNTPSRVAAGQVCFDFEFTPPSPAERVTFRAALVDDYVEEII